MQIFLGIDGGQSSTIALIADQGGRVLGWGHGGPCNHVSGAEAEAKLMRVITQCVADACDAAGLNAQTRFEAACCGMSGGPQDKRELLARLIRTERLIVKTDSEIALSGALAGGPGVVVIAGTGSIAFGRNEAGRLMRAGGWGHVFGDEGGAFDIVRKALRVSLRDEEGGGSPTALSTSLLHAIGANDANQALHWFYTPDWPRSRIAKLSELIDRLAGNGDGGARRILIGAAGDLAALAETILGRLFSTERHVPVAYVGGVFRSAIVLQEFMRTLDGNGSSRCIPPLLPPSAGALLDAFESVGVLAKLTNVPHLK